MNIFEEYTNKISNLIVKNSKFLELSNLNKLNAITIETPPSKFNFDLSCNVSLILGKENNINPIDLAKKIEVLVYKELKDFEKVEIAGPGFLNLRFSNKTIKKIIVLIYNNKEIYGKKKSNVNYNIEFVSANPTGPMHVGHCRGAIYGDVIANLLKFNGNQVTREFYVNDYGNQITNFTKSVI